MGPVLATSDGGQTWTANTIGLPINASWNSIYFLRDNTRGWVVGGGGTIYSTVDGGRLWAAQSSGTTNDLFSVKFFESEGVVTGAASGALGIALDTDDFGRTWNATNLSDEIRQPEKTAQEQKSLDSRQEVTAPLVLVSDLYDFVVDPDIERGWAVGDSGAIFSIVDGPRPDTSGTEKTLRSVAPVPGLSRAWAVGDGGTILTTRDGERIWEQWIGKTRQDLTAIHMHAAGQDGWVVGDGGTILVTRDGGDTWNQVIHRWLPAPWVWLMWFFSFVSLGPVVIRTKEKNTSAKTVRGIAERLASDRPLRPGDLDPLGFNAIAEGISRFLRNIQTEPPLTVAINGDWGTGKSSIMSLLKSDLERYRFRTVWFNAWHHQKEEHLFAALLETVREQAVPPLWTFDGLTFRLRLIWARLKHHPIRNTSFAILVALVAGSV